MSIEAPGRGGDGGWVTERVRSAGADECVQNRLERELIHGAPAIRPGRVPAGASAAAQRDLRGDPL